MTELIFFQKKFLKVNFPLYSAVLSGFTEYQFYYKI